MQTDTVVWLLVFNKFHLFIISEIFMILLRNNNYNTRTNNSANTNKTVLFVALKHYENMPIQIYWKFYHQMMKIFSKKSGIFIFLLKI